MKLKKFLSMLLITQLTTVSCFCGTVYADEVITEPVVVEKNTTENIPGNVEIKDQGGTAVTAKGEGAEVTIDGNVSNQDTENQHDHSKRNVTGISASEGASVEVNGNVSTKDVLLTGVATGVVATGNETNVVVSGDVNSISTKGSANGISAKDGANVTVNNVLVDGHDTSVGVDVEIGTGTKVVVNGDVNANYKVNPATITETEGQLADAGPDAASKVVNKILSESAGKFNDSIDKALKDGEQPVLSQKITEDLTGKNRLLMGVVVGGEENSLDIKGDLNLLSGNGEATSVGITSESGGPLNIEGNVTVVSRGEGQSGLIPYTFGVLTNGGIVDIAGNLEVISNNALPMGVMASKDGGYTKIGGDLITKGEDPVGEGDTIGVYLAADTKVEVGGKIKAGTAIWGTSGGTVIADEATGRIKLDGGSTAVLGTVNAVDNNESGIITLFDGSTLVVTDDVNTTLKVKVKSDRGGNPGKLITEGIVDTIYADAWNSSSNATQFYMYGYNNNGNEHVQNFQPHYLLKVVEAEGGRVEISAAKTLTVDSLGKTYLYADVNDTIEIVLIPNEGYNAVGLNSKISSRYDPATGKYYITVPSTGKIDIQGLFEDGRVIPVKPDEPDEPAKPSNENNTPVAEADVYYSPVLLNTESVNTLGAASDVVPAGAYNFSAYATPQGVEAGIKQIIQASVMNTLAENEKLPVTVYSDKPFAFNKSIINTICNSNVDFIYIFVHNGHVYRLTIPVGTDASMLLQETQVEGPMYIGALLGTVELIK